jgi:hypothetical protein
MSMLTRQQKIHHRQVQITVNREGRRVTFTVDSGLEDIIKAFYKRKIYTVSSCINIVERDGNFHCPPHPEGVGPDSHVVFHFESTTCYDRLRRLATQTDARLGRPSLNRYFLTRCTVGQMKRWPVMRFPTAELDIFKSLLREAMEVTR